jgi:hypothetical protein
MTHKLLIPDWHPTSLNRLLAAHWARRRRMKQDDAALIWGYGRLYDIPRVPDIGKRKVSLEVTLGPRDRQSDADNLLKSCLDGLRDAGLLVDDSPRWLELGPVTYTRGPRKQTVIVLEDV